MNLTYPAVITKEDDVFYITFPDFNKSLIDYSTYGDSFNNAIEMGKEYLTLELQALEDEEKEFPSPTDYQELKSRLRNNEEVIYINMNYDYEKSLSKLVYTKKTLTIPTYLDILARNKNLNFSQILQNALKKELGVK